MATAVLTPDRVRLAARNAWALTPLGGGIEPHTPSASTVVHQLPHCTVRRYSRRDAVGAPVLLVPPLAVSIGCYDLRPGQSLVTHLVAAGRPVYVVDYGPVRYRDRALGFEDFFAGVVPAAIAAVRADRAAGGAEDPDAGVDLIGWSLGGTISLLTAAHDPSLPIRSITTLGTPIDYHRNPTSKPLRALGAMVGHRPMATAVWALGGIPAPVVQLSYRATALQREVTRPWFIATNLTATESLAQMQAIDRFMAAMPGYPARLYNQMQRHLIMDNALATGRPSFAGEIVPLAQISVPVLAFAGASDVLATEPCVMAITDVLTGTSVRTEVVPGSHLGIVAGTSAPEHTWPAIDDFHAELDG